MDTSRSNLCQEDVKELLNLLESSNAETVNSVKALIQENLNGTKDTWLLHGLIDYHIAVQSKHALEILVRVREPHDKNLFDKITDYIKNENKRYKGLLLFSNIVHKQPTWLHKVANHRIFHTLLNVLKNDKDPPSLLCALFTTVCLLPIIPSQVGPYLNDIFEIFSRLASWSVKNSIGVPEIHVLHLQVGVYTLFHRLYGMYPCNFLGYLRSYYGRREYKEENLCVFTNAIKPMLYRVKLHPLLVTACKETELSHKRWRRMAPHDIIVECANISLDAIEGTNDDLQSKSTGFSGQLYPVSHENSAQYVSFSSQSSSTSVTVESNFAINGSASSKQDVLWSPSLLLETPSSPILLSSSDTGVLKKPLPNNLSPQDGVDVESPHFFHCTEEKIGARNSSDQDSVEKYSSDHPVLVDNMDVAEALEAKEEELADKEVSELTSSVQDLDREKKHLETRHDTPFCSTTQNLTDMPEISDAKVIDTSKDKNEEFQEMPQQQSEIKMEQVVQTIQTINRLRYFSQCCTPPNIPNEKLEKSCAFRSHSCPNFTFIEINSNYIAHDSIQNDSKVSSDILSSVPVSAAASSCCKNSIYHSTFNNTSVKTETSYDHLIPIVVQPMTHEKPTSSMACSTCLRCSSCNFTPAELLDRHILLSKENYIGQLNSIPLTSTKKINWTHFGGKAPPDEIQMLQTQILLLHNQLMFECHRREIHGERNRRLLGKAKRSRMQDEYTHALKDQVALLEKENVKLKKQLGDVHRLYEAVCEERKQSECNTECTIKKLLQEKKELHYNIKKLQGLLVAQKQEIDGIRDAQKLSQSKTLEFEIENEVMKREISSFAIKEKELLQLCKQNALLHELNQLYADKLEIIKQPVVANDTIDLFKDTACEEIRGLNQKLEAKTLEVDIGLTRISELEVEVSSLKSKLKDQIKIIEDMYALHEDKITAMSDRLTSLKKIISRKESHILELYHIQEDLNNKIGVLTSEKKIPQSSSRNSCDIKSVPSLKKSTSNACGESDSEKEHHNSDDFTIPVN